MTGSVEFRDPEPPHQRAGDVHVEVARALVNAPRIPIELPRYGLVLTSITAARDVFTLTVGEPGSGEAGYPLEIRWNAASARASVSAPRSSRNVRIARALESMRGRLEIAITLERWTAARAASRKLRALPTGIPLEFFRQIIPGVEKRGLVRTGFRCNQDCGFCWQSRDWGDFGPEQVRTWIEDVAKAGITRLSISGGEPTLDRQLAKHIRHARALGIKRVCLETNAVLLARDGRAAELAEAGLEEAFVSLHSSDPDVSDKLTKAPGTHSRTVAGVRALLDAGVRVQLSTVLVPAAIPTLPELPSFVASAFGAHSLLTGLSVSYPSRPFAPSPAEDPATVHPAVMRDVLTRTLRAAVESGVAMEGVAGPCGAPLCAFGADPRIVDPRRKVEAVPFRRYLAGCDACAVRSACFGVRHEDAERWGDACILPISDPP